MMDKIKRWLGTDKVCARYNDVSPRTIDRWINTGVLPPPTYINGRRFWDEQELEARERNRAEGRGVLKTDAPGRCATPTTPTNTCNNRHSGSR